MALLQDSGISFFNTVRPHPETKEHHLSPGSRAIICAPLAPVVPAASPLIQRVRQHGRAKEQVQKRPEPDPQATQGAVTLCSPHPGPWQDSVQ